MTVHYGIARAGLFYRACDPSDPTGNMVLDWVEVTCLYCLAVRPSVPPATVPVVT